MQDMKFICWEPYQGSTAEDGLVVMARDAEQAAESFVERDWEGAGYVTVRVRDESGVETRWHVEARSEVNFYAEPAPVETEEP